MLFIRYVPLHGLLRAALCCVWVGSYVFFLQPSLFTVIDHAPFLLSLPDFRNWASEEGVNNNVTAIITLVLWGMALALAGGKMLNTCYQKSLPSSSRCGADHQA
jgi:hypothetical protein